MSVIRTEQLGKRYGRRVGVERLNLAVPEGSVFGFLGPNGSGKTTTIRLLLGLLRPSAGVARVFGQDCWKRSDTVKAQVGYVPGDLRLYPWLTCRAAVRLLGRMHGRDLTDEGAQLAEDFDLPADLRSGSMSRGMRQKLGLILALAHRPRLLILDEPTSGLDPLIQEKLYARLRKLASSGHTVFLSSHTLGEVQQLCDRVAILREGTLVADETVHDLRTRARRTVSIQWHNIPQEYENRSPEFLDVHERRPLQWRATLTGSAMDLVRWSAGQPIEDLSIGTPDLARLFQQYYADREPAE